MNCWTRLFALLTLTLGTLAEGSAIAALSRTSSPRDLLPDQTEITQRSFRNQCAYIKEETGVFRRSSTAAPIPGVSLNRENIVRIIEDYPDGWVKIEDAENPRTSGFVQARSVDEHDDCDEFDISVQATPTNLQQRGQCYRVNKDLIVHSSPHIRRKTNQELFSGETVYQQLNTSIEPDDLDSDRWWIKVILLDANSPIEGWVEFRTPGNDENNLREC